MQRCSGGRVSRLLWFSSASGRQCRTGAVDEACGLKRFEVSVGIAAGECGRNALVFVKHRLDAYTPVSASNGADAF